MFLIKMQLDNFIAILQDNKKQWSPAVDTP